MYTPISMHSTLFLTDFFFSSFLLFDSSLNLAQKQNSLELMLSKRYSCEGRKKNSNSFAKKNQHDSRANITEEQRKKKWHYVCTLLNSHIFIVRSPKFLRNFKIYLKENNRK